MSDTAQEPQLVFHLYLHPEEVPVAASALRLFISDEARQQRIRTLAREVLALLDAQPGPHETLTVPLGEQQMKITYSAVHLLLDDLQREQAAEREILWSILNKLPDEHTMRAIEID